MRQLLYYSADLFGIYFTVCFTPFGCPLEVPAMRGALSADVVGGRQLEKDNSGPLTNSSCN